MFFDIEADPWIVDGGIEYLLGVVVGDEDTPQYVSFWAHTRAEEKAGQATLIGDVFDDAATGQGLMNYFIRGMNSGALTEDEALASGLTLEELRSRSFVRILQGRRAALA